MYKLEQISESSIYEISSATIVLTSVQSSLDLIGELSQFSGSKGLIINKEQISEEFFDLSNGLAGEILQKFIMYNVQLVIVGNFDQYQKKSFKDFMYECNQQKNIMFVNDRQSAIDELSRG